MKKVLSLFVLLCTVFAGAWAETTEVTSLVTTYDVAHPATYRMWLRDSNSNLCIITQNLKQYGYDAGAAEARFAFVPVNNEANMYFIYETVSQKYVRNKVTSTQTKSATELVTTLTSGDNGNLESCKWKIVASTQPGVTNRWLISPKGYNTYMNFYKGLNENKTGETIGFYTDGNSDQGSRWAFDLIEDNTNVELEDYAINFDKSLTVSDRQIQKLHLGDTEMTLSDNNKEYRDLHETVIFEVTKGETVKPGITTSGTWVHGMLYVDADKNGQFEISSAEMVSTTTLSGADNVRNNFSNYQVNLEPGDYRMRFKTDWVGGIEEGKNPAGRMGDGGKVTGPNGIVANRGCIVDVTLRVNAPAATQAMIKYEYKIGEEKIAEENFLANINEQFPDPTLSYPFYNLGTKPNGNVTEAGTHTIALNWDGPFVADGTTTYALGVRLKTDGNANYYVKSDGTNAPSRSTTTVQNTAAYLWMFERVAGTADQFYLKNLKYGYINTNTDAKSTMHATNKTAMKLGEYTGTNHQEGNKDFYLIDAVNNTQVFGDHKSSNLGYWNNGLIDNEGSAFQVVQTEVAPDWAGLATIIVEAESYTFGTGYGSYTAGSDYAYALFQAKTMHENHLKNPPIDSTVELVDEAINELRTAINNLTINVPQPGAFLRIKNNASKKYLAFTGNDNAQVPLQQDGTGKETILYYDANRHIISYSKGQGLKDTHSQCPVGGTMETATFGNAGNGLYSIQSNYSGSKVWHGSGSALNRQGSVDNNCKWILEEVTSLPVTLPASGITTFYAPVAMQVGGDVNVYVGAIDEGETTITYTKLVDNKIPAETGVLIKGASNAEITISPINEEVGNMSSIILGKEFTTACSQDGTTFIYTLNSGVFQYYAGSTLAGFKGHLELKNDHRQAGASAFRVIYLDDEVTSIESINSQVQSQKIYDLSGRKVSNAQRGLYIMNGNKILR